MLGAPPNGFQRIRRRSQEEDSSGSSKSEALLEAPIPEAQPISEESRISPMMAFYGGLFGALSIPLAVMYFTLGECLDLQPSENPTLDPRLDLLYQCFSQVQTNKPVHVRFLFVSLYFVLQSFAIPGTILLSILSGALFNFMEAEVWVALAATSGATVSYGLSRMVGPSLITFFKLDSRINAFESEIQKRSGIMLTLYLILIRIAPFPNILINILSPHLGVGVGLFFFTTLLGLIPLNTVHILSGTALRDSIVHDNSHLVYLIFGGAALVMILLFLGQKYRLQA